MDIFNCIFALFSGMIISAGVTYLVFKSKARALETAIAEKDIELKSLKAELEASGKMHEKIENEIRESSRLALDEVKKSHSEALKTQIDALKASMQAETEEILRKREEELSKKAEETFNTISGNLAKDISSMKEAFEANKKSHVESASALKENLSKAIGKLEENTMKIGGKADNLADALRGKNKMQGCWGETILQTLLENEGFVEGINYDKEETLRGKNGDAVINEDSGQKMRPDYIIHFPDKNDVVVDSKVSLTALADYIQANDEITRKDAASRNLASIKEQVRKLSNKNYSSYLPEGHKMLDYAIMFVPNYSALQLAYQEDPKIWRDAFAKNVLITTEETLMPFLRMITIAWRNTEQVRNQEKIIDGAQKMIERVSDLVKHFEILGKKLEDAQTSYEKCNSKLKNSGQSIVRSAKEVVRLGVPENKNKGVSDIDLID